MLFHYVFDNHILMLICRLVSHSYGTFCGPYLFHPNFFGPRQKIYAHHWPRVIVNRFMAVGSRYAITAFSISLRTVRLKIWDSFASSMTVSHEDVHSTFN